MNNLTNTTLDAIKTRTQNALFGMFIGDALAMPVHWYYDRSRITQDFPPNGITKYEKPVDHFPGSIMALSNTGGGGRGSNDGDIIGEVIMHGKKKFWSRSDPKHYHHGMAAGENTLDTLLARLLLKTYSDVGRGLISSSGGVDMRNTSLVNEHAVSSGVGVNGIGLNMKESLKEIHNDDGKALVNTYLNNYVAFLTNEGNHNDTYAATAHRMFFANYIKKKNLNDCADNDGHNTDSIDGIINVVPVTLADVGMKLVKNSDTCINNDVSIEPTKPELISNVINALRKSNHLPPYGSLYSSILTDVITNKKSLKNSILETANKLDPSGSFARQIEQSPTKPDSQNPMTACYIDSSFPALLYFAYKYADDPKAGLLASANAGGENVNRSAVLGALLGAQLSSVDGWGGELVSGLHDEAGLRVEIERFTDVFFG